MAGEPVLPDSWRHTPRENGSYPADARSDGFDKISVIRYPSRWTFQETAPLGFDCICEREDDVVTARLERGYGPGAAPAPPPLSPTASSA